MRGKRAKALRRDIREALGQDPARRDSDGPGVRYQYKNVREMWEYDPVTEEAVKVPYSYTARVHPGDIRYLYQLYKKLYKRDELGHKGITNQRGNE